MGALSGVAGSENRLISFFQRTKSLLAEAEQYISVFPSVENRWNRNVTRKAVRGWRELLNSPVQIVVWKSKTFTATWMSFPYT